MVVVFSSVVVVVVVVGDCDCALIVTASVSFLIPTSVTGLTSVGFAGLETGDLLVGRVGLPLMLGRADGRGGLTDTDAERTISLLRGLRFAVAAAIFAVMLNSLMVADRLGGFRTGLDDLSGVVGIDFDSVGVGSGVGADVGGDGVDVLD